MLKGPKRSIVVVVVLVGVETWVKSSANRTKNISKGTENVREQNLFLIEQKMFAMKIAPNWT